MRFSTLIALAAVAVLSVGPARADLKQGLAAIDERDFPKAAKLLAEAFEKGEPDAAFYMGRLLELGMGGRPDLQGAVAMYAAGAAKGSPAAKNRLGIMHVDGQGVLQDYQKGAQLVCEAAGSRRRQRPVQLRLASRAGKGAWPKARRRPSTGIGARPKRTTFRQSTRWRSPIRRGAASPPIPRRRSSSSRRPRRSPIPSASTGWATPWSKGLGTERDPVKAHAYFNLAAAAQMPEAAEARATLEAQMTPEQVAQAQQFARAWRPTPVETAARPEGGEPSKPKAKPDAPKAQPKPKDAPR